MITHKCEACGKSEDYSSHFDTDDGGKLSRVNSKLCHNCARVYREIELERAEEYNERHKDMVTEVRKKLGIEPHDQRWKINSEGPKTTKTMHELLRTWWKEVPAFRVNKPLFDLLFEIIVRLEEPE